MKFPATHKYLELVKAYYDGASDYKIAQFLDVKKQTVSKWRNDLCGMSEETGMIIADRLQLDVVEVVTELNRDRASSRVAREYYDRILTRFRSSAALVLLALSSMQPLTEVAANAI